MDRDGGAQTSGGLRVGILAFDAAGLEALMAHHAAHSAAHYPESNHGMDAAALEAADVRLFGGWAAGRLVAMGGYVPIAPDEAEVKSMHVLQEARGTGAGRAILDAIVQAARREGVARLRLETGSGPASAPARALYARSGFVETPPFGAYAPDPQSVFMCRDL
ncbi:GNAT family N-acetyltransferase [Roseibacterium sp. SDUM158017]|uniref:GNAT family N-acetyltransferase n=1 Tax=Roseicyclus salinarum TaxID=3036773 RepID=UPI00241512C8|nr:GNAT family N-acetyltransferase [Roseibacterium sp. SDUM158017]MDG4647991.1 GNAT family N-acetyltransferase [Roseibacterium sp. SDUM158017]